MLNKSLYFQNQKMSEKTMGKRNVIGISSKKYTLNFRNKKGKKGGLLSQKKKMNVVILFLENF